MNGKPTVEIALNETARLILLRDKSLAGENSYGPSYMYSVMQDGTEKVLFASAGIHQKIPEAGIKKDDIFELREVTTQNGKKVTASVAFSVVEKKNGTPQHTDGISFDIPDDGFKELMKRCVREAVNIVKEVNTIPWQNADMRSLAISIFIQRTRG